MNETRQVHNKEFPQLLVHMKHAYQIWVWEKIFHADRPNPDLNSLTEEAYNTFFPSVIDPGLIDRTIYDVIDIVCGEHNGED